ncbi:MAG: SDR family oxidoreductase [Lachnospiraceae bacterium]|nr:SDR family oxidoreductase [Lachnospiraceae bacterium]
MKFNNRVVLITGASTGIGKATAIKFAQNGAKLILLDVDFEKLQTVKEQLSQYTSDVMIYHCDISDEASVNRVTKDALDQFGKIDVLVNNAGLWRNYDLFQHISSDTWKKLIDVNLMGTVYVTKAVLEQMLDNGYGRIINVASVAGVYGNANMTHYSATKGAIIAMTKALAKEVSSKGVLVNCVSPGSVSPAEKDDVDYYQDSNLAFMGRTGTTMENANLIYFLASDEASYISGQNIQIDGCRKKQ